MVSSLGSCICSRIFICSFRSILRCEIRDHLDFLVVSMVFVLSFTWGSQSFDMSVKLPSFNFGLLQRSLHFYLSPVYGNISVYYLPRSLHFSPLLTSSIYISLLWNTRTDKKIPWKLHKVQNLTCPKLF